MDNRITELEIKVAHLEDSLNQLSDVLHEQQRLIDNLQSGQKQLQQLIAESEESSTPQDESKDKPPHY